MTTPVCIFKPDKKPASAVGDLKKLPLEEILDHKVVVISIAGRFRQGKSFLMSVIIKYLRACGELDWFKEGDLIPDDCFAWKHTKNAVTMGVLIWPETFKIRSASGQELVVILIDTQGIFDPKSSVSDCTKIFSLSVLLSSIQIFNVQGNIQGDDLSHLQLFAELGRLVCKGSQEQATPFQDLIYLVRDWTFPDDNPFGWEGGKKALTHELEAVGLQKELAKTRDSIKNCFESTRCFLMPHPGNIVTSCKFRGAISDMEEGFRQHMKSFVEDIFHPSRLKAKKHCGKEVTLRDFLGLVERYALEMHSDQLPSPTSLYEATVGAANTRVVNSCFDSYREKITEYVLKEPRKPDDFETRHQNVVSEVYENFKKSAVMGGEDEIEAALEDLKKRIAAARCQFKQLNDAELTKKIFEEKSRELCSIQQQLQEQIKRSGDANGELRKEVEALKKESEETSLKFMEADSRYKKVWEELKALKESASCLIF